MTKTKLRTKQIKHNNNISFPVGTAFAVKKYSEKLDFEHIFSKFKQRGIPLKGLVEALISYKLSENLSLTRGSDWINRTEVLDEFGLKSFEQKTLYRAIETIAVNYQDNGVVGFDLAGKERGFRPKTLIEVIHPVLDNFLPVTIHAGEEDSVASIAEAVRYLHADRIGHGITLRESGKLFNYIDEGRIALEICPTSNVDTGSVASISTHPIRAYHKAGLRISVNTDNRTISDTTLSNAYIQLMNQLGFDQRDIFMLARHAIKAAFLRSDPTKKLLNEFDKYVTSQGIKNWSRYTTE